MCELYSITTKPSAGILRLFHRLRILIALVLVSTNSAIARCEDLITRGLDGRYLVQVKDVTIALPEEDPMARMTLFSLATPPGTSPFSFTLTDLVRDPSSYLSRMRSSEWSSFRTSQARLGEISGQKVVKGVTGVGILSGVDKNCDGWQPNWARLREAAIGLPADRYGWTRQDDIRSPPTSTFIKFLDQGDRAKSRYYVLYCDFSGGCDLRACHNYLTTWISIHSSNKIQREDYSVKDFDEQIASGIEVLQHIVLTRQIDLSHF